MKKTTSKVMIFLLMFISMVVAVGLAHKDNMWKWIVAYWVTLSVKNIIDYFTE